VRTQHCTAGKFTQALYGNFGTLKLGLVGR
jgi:hypothetical protein